LEKRQVTALRVLSKGLQDVSLTTSIQERSGKEISKEKQAKNLNLGEGTRRGRREAGYCLFIWVERDLIKPSRAEQEAHQIDGEKRCETRKVSGGEEIGNEKKKKKKKCKLRILS